MRKLLAIGVVAALMQLVGSVESAQAQYFSQPWGGGLAWNWPFYVQERVPYFAAHPPVYYSTPIARSYGHSPFPYPSTLWQVPQRRELRVANTFVAPVPQLLSVVEVPVSKPEVVNNPFVK